MQEPQRRISDAAPSERAERPEPRDDDDEDARRRRDPRARRRQREKRAEPAGDALAAAPLEPRRIDVPGRTPRTPSTAATSGPSRSHSAAAVGSHALAVSSSSTTTPVFLPSARATLVAPMLPEPTCLQIDAARARQQARRTGSSRARTPRRRPDDRRVRRRGQHVEGTADQPTGGSMVCRVQNVRTSSRTACADSRRGRLASTRRAVGLRSPRARRAARRCRGRRGGG